MEKHLSIWIRLIAVAFFFSLLHSCSEPPPPPPKPKAVRKKIAAQAPKPAPAAPKQVAEKPAPPPPATETAKAAPPKPVEKAETPAPVKQKIPAPAAQPPATEAKPAEVAKAPPPAVPAPEKEAPGAPAEMAEEDLAVQKSEVPSETLLAIKLDPFEPLFREEEVKVKTDAEKVAPKPDRRVPMTPLEKIDLSQLRLTAVFVTPSGNKALVEEASGKGYIVNPGTYIGLQSGKVIQIDRDRVLIEENVENAIGEVTVETKELKLPKSFGEE